MSTRKIVPENILTYVLLGVSAVVLAIAYARGQGKWGDIIIDYGRELYIPWQISKGKSLYLDVANYFGPLSSYINANIFTIFGTSTRVIQNFNFVILILTCILIFNTIKFASSDKIASVCVLVFLLFTGTSTYESLRNYNFISPYSHELMHGLFLGFVIVFLLTARQRIILRTSIFLIGLFLGCISIAKSETFLATAAALLYYLTATIQTNEHRIHARGVFSFLLGFICVPALFLIYLSSKMPILETIRSLTLMYTLPFSPPEPMRVFFSNISGSANPAKQLGMMATSCLLIFLLYYVYHLISKKIQPSSPLRKALLLLCYLTPFIAIAAKHAQPDFPSKISTTFLPPFLVIAFFKLHSLIRSNAHQMRQKLIILNTLTVYSLAMMLKVILNPTPDYYSSFLILPGLLTFTATTLWLVPHLRAPSEKFPIYLLAPPLIMLFMVIYPKARLSATIFNAPAWITQVASTPDEISVNRSQSDVIIKILHYIKSNKKDNDTLSVMPEGIGLNYLLRMDNPTKFINLAPPEWFTFGGTRIEKAFTANPPNWIVLLHRDNMEYETDYFGKGYAQNIISWIKETYACEACFGAPPFETKNGFGACIYRLANKQNEP
ncbi:hypothetical protein [Fundidesulfovibrio terrae]|uniref:hypothetical protein n=1 Tax=Fundidesulfovibrio terrae TaxID=2922866 RepID=UPI001FAF1A48|nr:hypothetical protein [Fundidesulfovibrio terrae]